MAAEFYRKSTALYEEFKRRELHYLNVERSSSSYYGTKDELNLPLEDYLEKINRREKESERSYRDVLKNLEEMDKRTEDMSLKLDKLNVLRNAATSSNITSWPSMNPAFDQTFYKPYYGSTFLPSTPTSSFNPTIHARNLHANPVFDYPSTKTDSQSQSTQTEHIFCDQCHYPFTTSSIYNTANESVKLDETMYMECMTDLPSTMDPKKYVNRENVSSMDPNEFLHDRFISNDSPSKTSIPGLSGNVVTKQNNVTQCGTQNRNVTNTEDPLMTGMPRNASLPVHSDNVVTKPGNVNQGVTQNRNVTYAEDPLMTGMPRKASIPVDSDNVVTKPSNVNKGVPQNRNVTNADDPLKINDKSVSRNGGVPSPESIKTKTEILDQIDGSPEIQCKPESRGGFVIKSLDEDASVTTEDQMSSLEGCVDKAPIQSNDGSKSKMFETVASKSDDESINNEFDFLESDRRPSMKNRTTELERRVSIATIDNVTENVKHNAESENVLENNPVETNSKANVEVKSQYKGVTDTEISSKNVKNSISLLTPRDAKIDSSLSEGSPSPAHHSADDSNHSESDSFSEKETPFTASAAYQALLGNTAVPKAVQKAPSPSDSDSEDEIENVVSSHVRRTSNINFDALTQVQKKEDKKSNVPEVKPKIDTKASKPASTGISQTKLSKNTRKVLGLETSSESEVELEAKSKTNKIEEDDGEFDFFD